MNYKIRNHIDNCSPSWLQSQLAPRQCFSCDWSRPVLALQSQTVFQKSPKWVPISCMHAEHHLPRCFHGRWEVNHRLSVKDELLNEKWGREKKKRRKAGRSKGHHLSSVKKRLSAKYAPTTFFIYLFLRNKVNFSTALPLKSHTECTFFFSCLKLKHPWFKVHSVMMGGGRWKEEWREWLRAACRVMQHVESLAVLWEQNVW